VREHNELGIERRLGLVGVIEQLQREFEHVLRKLERRELGQFEQFRFEHVLRKLE
jgi:hypothetical protein